MFVAWQPSAVKGVAALVASRPLESWKDYLRFHVIDQYADVLPRAFAEAAADMHGDQRTRDERALAITQSAMAGCHRGALRRALLLAGAEGAGTRHHRERGRERSASTSAHAAWLSPASRKIALAKLDRLYVGIGYPEDVGELERSSHRRPTTHLATRSASPSATIVIALARLAKPYDPHEWVMTPQTVGRGSDLPAECLHVLGGAAPAAEVRLHRVGCGDLWRHRRDHRPRHEPLRGCAGGRLRARRPHAPLVERRRLGEVRGGSRADRATVLGVSSRSPISMWTDV